MNETAAENVTASSRTERFAQWLVRRRWLVAILSIVGSLALAAGAQFLSFNVEYSVWFSKENPELVAFERVQNIYTRNDSILVILAPKDGNAFSARTLDAVEALTRAAWKVPFSRRVDSVANFQHTRAKGDDLVVADLVKGAKGKTAAELAAIRKIALKEPALARRLVSAKGHVTAVNIVFAFPRKEGDERPRAARAVRELRDQIAKRYPDIAFRLSGLVMMDLAFFEASERDLQILTPAMFLVVAIVLALLLRSLTGTLVTLLLVLLASAAAMGVAGWMRLEVTPPLATAPTIILTLAVADSVHILVTMLNEMRGGRTKHAAIVESLRVNFQPIFLTSVTTAIGFLSMNFSDAPPFRDMGNVAATGVMIALVLSVTMLPSFLAILPVRVRQRASSQDGRFERLGAFVVGRRHTLLVGSGALIVFLIAFIPRIELNDDFVKYFDESLSFRADTDFMTKNLSGIYTLEYSLPASGQGAVAEPAYLKGLERFAKWLNSQGVVTHVSTLSDTMRRINKSMHGDDQAWYKLPDKRKLAAQYLLLYELSLPFGLDLNDQIDVGKSATRVIVTIKDVKAREFREAALRIDAWTRGNLPKMMAAQGTGPSLMFARISDRNIRSMLTGTAIALLLISVLLVFAFRSVKLGLISLIPNLVPAAMAFGFWALTVRLVDVSVSVIAAISLGIVVDDTIHFLSKYRRGREEHGHDAEGAVRYAFRTVGMALSVNTLVLVAGFAVLAFSLFGVNARMGLMTAMAIGFALLIDFFFLPPLLMLLEKRRENAGIAPDSMRPLD
jgi:predicted RND superfamily exporter protein